MSAEVDIAGELLTPTAYALAGAAEPGTPEWIEQRTHGMGGSDAPVVLGHNPYKDAYWLCLEKMRHPLIVATEEAQPFSEARHFGTALEPFVVAEAARRISERTGRAYRVTKPPLLRDVKCSYRIANLDGLLTEADAPAGAMPCAVVEAKCTGLQNLAAWRDGPPQQAVDQVMHYLLVTGLPVGYLACLVAGQKFFLYEVYPDDGAFEALATAEAEFWQHVLDGTPPLPSSATSTTRFLRELHPRAEPGSVLELSTPDDAALLYEYRTASEEAKAASTRLDRAANQLRIRLADHEAATVDGRTVCTYKTSEVTRLDQKALEAAEPELYRRFTVTRPQRSLRLT